MRSGREVTVVATEKELQEAVRGLEDGARIIVNATDVSLTKTLFVDAKRVSIEGSRRRDTILRCPGDGHQSAIVIRQTRVRDSQALYGYVVTGEERLTSRV